eukprot:5053237-Alexandrium_andersonii.AAC.1
MRSPIWGGLSTSARPSSMSRTVPISPTTPGRRVAGVGAATVASWTAGTRATGDGQPHNCAR